MCVLVLPYGAAGAAPHWRLVRPKNTAEQPFVAAFSAADFGATGDGVQDNTRSLQDALDATAAAGGGTVFVPVGRYVVRGHLDIPIGVCLRGEWQTPGAGGPVRGTLLMAYGGRGQDDPPRKSPTLPGHLASLITVNKSAALRDVAIWYPEQEAATITPYPSAVLISGNYATVEDVTLVNAYRGVACAEDGDASCFNIRGIYGSPLSVGVEIDNVADVGRLQRIAFSPYFWATSGLPGSPRTADAAGVWIANHGIGILMRRNDWSYGNDIAVTGYAIGFESNQSISTPDSVPNGYCDNVTFTDCGIGLDCVKSWMQFSHVRTEGCRVGVQGESAFDGLIKLRTCRLSGTEAALADNGTGRVMMQQCALGGPVSLAAGSLSLVDSTDSAAAPQIRLAPSVSGAILIGNRFAQTLQVIHEKGTVVALSPAPHPSPELPQIGAQDAAPYHAAQPALYIVTDAPFGAKADKVQDATGAIQRALAAAKTSGGGIVFVPPGEYAVRGTLTVPAGVELRGAEDWPHDTLRNGTVLDFYAGRDAPQSAAAIHLAPGSGARGLTCVYPEQRMDDIHPYPFLVQTSGADCYACDIAALNPYQLIDAASYRSDRHYIARITGSALRKGFVFGGGSVDGRIEDCQQNCGVIAYGQESWRGGWEWCPVLGTSENYKRSTDLVFTDQWKHFDNYILGNCRRETLYNDFCFGGHYGLTLGGQPGEAPTGILFGTAFDQNTQDIHAEQIGAEGFPIVNGQFVTVGNQDFAESAYFALAPSFQHNLLIEQCDLWGNPRQGMLIEGGNLVLDTTSIRNPGGQGFAVTAGTVQATNLLYNQNSPLGTADTLTHVFLLGAILPAAQKEQAEAHSWKTGLYAP